jgi:hypothetical protein
MTRTKTRSNGFVTHYSAIHIMMASPTEPTPENLRRQQLTLMHQGMAAIEAGKPTSADWRNVVDSVNIMETLVLMRWMDDSSGLLQDATAAIAKTYIEGGSHPQLSPTDTQAVRAVLEDYAAALEALSYRVMVMAHRATEKRLHAVLSGRRAHGAKVLVL